MSEKAAKRKAMEAISKIRQPGGPGPGNIGDAIVLVGESLLELESRVRDLERYKRRKEARY